MTDDPKWLYCGECGSENTLMKPAEGDDVPRVVCLDCGAVWNESTDGWVDESPERDGGDDR